jgi:DNA adenine methylase
MENIVMNSIESFPGTRYMGSKAKLIERIWESIEDLKFDSFLDGFSGSGVVSYFAKTKEKKVISNDFLRFCFHYTHALIENNEVVLEDSDLDFLLTAKSKHSRFIEKTFRGLYFEEDENKFLDKTRKNINDLKSPFKKSLALAALSRACFKKRPRGVFTYVGARYDDGRKDIRKTLEEHFIDNVHAFNNAVFDNGMENKAFNKDIYSLRQKADLVYFDPPYLSLKSDNDYTRRYHFVEGLVREWQDLTIQEHTSTKKFARTPSKFDSKATIYGAFDSLFSKYKDSIIVLSYSSNCIPTKTEMIALLKKYKRKVQVVELDYKYSFANQNHKIGDNFNDVKEYVFIGK